MKVYVVLSMHFASYQVEGVFATEGLAKDFMENNKPDQDSNYRLKIHEWEVQSVNLNRQPLTDDEIKEAFEDLPFAAKPKDITRAIEKAHGIVS